MIAKTLVTLLGALFGFAIVWVPMLYPVYKMCTNDGGEFSWLQVECQPFVDYYLVMKPLSMFVLVVGTVSGAIGLRYIYAKLTG